MVACWKNTVLAAVGTAVVFLGMGASRSEAVAIISFDQSEIDTSGGTLTYDGSGALIGSDIAFDIIKGSGTPLSGNIRCAVPGQRCMILTFQTGPNTLEDIGAKEYEWGPGTVPGGSNFFRVTLADDLPALGLLTGDILLEGTINSARFGPTFLGFDASTSGPDVKHPEIVKFFFGDDPPPTFRFGNTEIAADKGSFVQDTTTGAFSVDVSNADIDNVAPEPGTSLLLLLGLGSLAAYRKRRS